MRVVITDSAVGKVGETIWVVARCNSVSKFRGHSWSVPPSRKGGLFQLFSCDFLHAWSNLSIWPRRGAILGYSHLLLLPLCVCDEEAIWKCQSLGVYSSIRGLMWSLRWTCAQLEMIWSETMEESFFAEFFSIPRPNLVSIWIGMPQGFLLFGPLGVYI